MTQRLLSILLLLMPAHAVMSQEAPSPQRHVINAKMAAIGYNSVQDTYLSPESYGGGELRYISHTIRETEGCRWSRLIINEGYGAYGKSRSENGATLSAAYRFQYGLMRDIGFTAGPFSLRAGVQGEFIGGFIYNTRNGNNPAQAIVSLDAGPLVHAEYSLSKVRLSYEASCPLLGLTFSPAYGQSYYEIFERGDYDHNVVPVTIVSMPSLRHTLTADIPFLGVTWRIGYLGDYRQQDVNHLKRHIYTSAFMVGIVVRR